MESSTTDNGWERTMRGDHIEERKHVGDYTLRVETEKASGGVWWAVDCLPCHQARTIGEAKILAENALRRYLEGLLSLLTPREDHDTHTD